MGSSFQAGCGRVGAWGCTLGSSVNHNGLWGAAVCESGVGVALGQRAAPTGVRDGSGKHSSSFISLVCIYLSPSVVSYGSEHPGTYVFNAAALTSVRKAIRRGTAGLRTGSALKRSCHSVDRVTVGSLSASQPFQQIVVMSA